MEKAFGCTQPLATNKFRISFNPYLCVAGLENLLYNVCLHELGHYIQYKKIFAEDLLFFDNSGKLQPRGSITDDEFIYLVGEAEQKGHSKY